MAVEHEADGYTTSLTVRNSRSCSLTFIVEPWGDEHEMPTGCAYEVIAHGPKGGKLELETTEDVVIVYAWPGAIVTVLRDGVSVDSSPRPPVPPVPPGQSAADFVRFMFRQELRQSDEP